MSTLSAPWTRRKMCGATSVSLAKVGVGRFRRGLISQSQDLQGLANYTGSTFWVFANLISLSYKCLRHHVLILIFFWCWGFSYISTSARLWHYLQSQESQRRQLAGVGMLPKINNSICKAFLSMKCFYTILTRHLGSSEAQMQDNLKQPKTSNSIGLSSAQHTHTQSENLSHSEGCADPSPIRQSPPPHRHTHSTLTIISLTIFYFSALLYHVYL